RRARKVREALVLEVEARLQVRRGNRAVKNTEIALSYAKQAKERLHHAREALERGNYPYVVRQCQEAVELMLKAALRLVGVEPPRWRDVGPVLRREAARFPE
ncbi:MAG: HEPN domain-containing protein, partial [Thermofilum sp.]